MPLVKMPDGQTVMMPDKLSPELAGRFKKMLADKAGQQPQIPGTTAPPPPGQKPFGSPIQALGDVGLSMATSAIAKPLSDIGELVGMGKELISPDVSQQYHEKGPEAFKRAIQEKLTYQPRTAMGEALTEYNPLALIGKGVGWLGGKAEQMIAPPGSEVGRQMTGAAVKEAISQAPAFLGVKAGKEAALKQASRQAELDILKGENRPLDVIRTESQKMGLTTPPEGVSWLSSIPGLSKVTDWLSGGNHEKVKPIIAKFFGMKPGTPLNADELGLIRNEEGKSYQAVIDAGNDIKHPAAPIAPPTPSFVPEGYIPPPSTPQFKKGFVRDDQFDQFVKSNIDSIDKEMTDFPYMSRGLRASKKVLQEFGDKDIFSPASLINKVKDLRHDASALFRKQGSNSSDMANAYTMRALADQLEDLMDRNLQKVGRGDLIPELQKSRQKIAQTYDVESALDPAGNVDMRKLYILSKKEGKLSGDLKKIADFAGAFPEAAKKTRSGQAAFNFWDWALMSGAVISGHPGVALGDLAARVGVPALAKRGLLQKKTPTYKASSVTPTVAPPMGIITTTEAQRRKKQNE